jgi:hypothetical protein
MRASPWPPAPPVGYDRAFRGGYRPNETFYLSAGERARLANANFAKLL